ncbi:diiron oxygenase [Pseudomonas sp. SC11]|uniref:diiron oxygenase n=1 Tax=Pseudomonas sp. SC11 TaxID=326927 RepID=UPI003999AA0D
MKFTTRSCRTVAAFSNWVTSSSVRSRPYTYLLSSQDLQETNPDRWFPSSMAPMLEHPLVTSLPLPERLRIHQTHLIYFLDYTTDLEITHINEAVKLITHGELKHCFSSEQHQIALKIYTDEGYHAFFSREISDQLKRHLNLNRNESTRLKNLSILRSSTSKRRRALACFLIAFVSETLITKELLSLTRDALIPSIFYMLRDHLRDEDKHSVYFSECFQQLWSTLSKPERAFASVFLLKVILTFSNTDKKFLPNLLDVSQIEKEKIFSDLNSQREERVASLFQPTIQTLKRTDFFENRQTFNLYKCSGIIA